MADLLLILNLSKYGALGGLLILGAGIAGVALLAVALYILESRSLG